MNDTRIDTILNKRERQSCFVTQGREGWVAEQPARIERSMPSPGTACSTARHEAHTSRHTMPVQWQISRFHKTIKHTTSARCAILLSVSVVLLMLCHATAEVQMETIQAADGSLPMGAVGALSTDGSLMTGSRWSMTDYLPESYRWESGSNVVEITPGSAPSASPSAYLSEGWGISDNAQVIVGWNHETQPGAFCWVDGSLVALTSTRGSMAVGLSRDGAIAVGRDPTDIKATSIEAVSWSTTDGSRTVLPDLAGGATLASAQAISSNKTTIVGWGTDSTGRQACRWEGASVSPLGDLPGGRMFSEASAVSGDGAVIVGRSWSSNGIEAFRWSPTNGIEGLGDLPGGCVQSEATGISDDGQIITGVAHSDVGPEVFVWNPTNGMRSLRTFMKASGEDISGWQFGSTRPVLSGDGDVLAGQAVDLDQNFVMFRVSGIREMTNCLVRTLITCRKDASEMVLCFPTEPGLRYQAEGAATMGGESWTPLGAPVIGTGSIQEIRMANAEHVSCQFYRINVSN